MEAVAVISARRTGAGQLFALLANIEAVAPRDGLFDNVSTAFGPHLDAAEAAAGAAGHALLAFRLTPALPREAAEEVLSRPGLRAVFVVRRNIDTYVSLAKATALGAFRDRDLTAVKVKLDAAHFAAWLDAQEAWYGHWQAWLARRAVPVPVLRYETHIFGLPADTVLRRFAAAVAQVGLTVRVPAALPHAGLVRQDRGRIVALKVRNWADFSRGLVARGLEKRAFGYPLPGFSATERP